MIHRDVIFQHVVFLVFNYRDVIFQHVVFFVFHPCLLALLVPCPELIFFFRVTLVTIAIMFHNPILIITLWASLLRF